MSTKVYSFRLDEDDIHRLEFCRKKLQETCACEWRPNVIKISQKDVITCALASLSFDLNNRTPFPQDS